MASNLDYLDPALVPLEEKVRAFLEAEKSLRRATDALKSHSLQRSNQASASFGQEQPTSNGSAEQEAQALTQTAEKQRQELARLEQEIIAMLPTRDEWLKVNLGYGPSRVGAWHVPATGSSPERYELRVVH